MANLPVASNVQAGAVAGLITVMILHVFAANNIIIPPDVANSLTMAMPVIVAHIWDMIAGTTKCN